MGIIATEAHNTQTIQDDPRRMQVDWRHQEGQQEGHVIKDLDIIEGHTQAIKRSYGSRGNR